MTPPIVFFFGGQLNATNNTESLRQYILDHLSKKDKGLYQSLVIPENFNDWLHDSMYPDLLTFEKDLAGTATLIVIALESAGAIAELGSFASHKELSEKLIIIMTEKHHSEKSFITLGPLRQVPESNVFAYGFDLNDVTTFKESLILFAESLNHLISESSKGTTAFKVENSGHVSFLVLELIIIFKALKLREIREYLKTLGVETQDKEIKQRLFLLEKLGLIGKRRIGNVDFYLALKADQRINFKCIENTTIFDRNAVMIGTSGYYEETRSEVDRRRALGTNLEGNSQ